MDAKQQDEIDDAMRAVVAGYAVLDEAEINPEFAEMLREVLDAQVLDDGERKLLGLPPLESMSVPDFIALVEGQEE
jgi:hypothetical protein